MKFSEKILSVKPSATLTITSKAKAMKKEGKDVIILAAGEPDHDTPDVIKKAAIKAINDGLTKYTPASGTLSLKKAVCGKLKKENGIDYSTDEIVISNGAKHSIFNALLSLCNEGDEVMIVEPYWVSYPEMVKIAGGVPVALKTSPENGLKLSPETLEKAITEKTKALILNSPSNPSGVVYDRSELEEIAGICADKGVYIISDEIYEHIIYDGKKHVAVASLSEEIKKMTITINGVSKSHSMTGWRIGYMACDKKIADLASTLQGQATSNPCSISQAAAEAALTEDMSSEFGANLEKFTKRRDRLIELLEDEDRISPLKPQGAFYMFCDISACGLDSLTFAKRLLDEKSVAVIPGGPFGDDRFVRISFATDMQTIEEGMRRIKDWVKTL
ncbi:MAG: aminotransferase class I/II-fold pyridoxal phosphate-dependent enzyme [Candidatus Omnitrophica bacterium]|nr:aminotransferase class I/II-fold pyridoxal phosphate-dependent enzyme [Candidatus Omnitrophota bacterium]